jgi:hypothetical protein
MMRKFLDTRIAVILAIAGLLLVVGLIVEMGFARPRLREISRLIDERSQLLSQIRAQQMQDGLSDEMAEHLGVGDLSELASAPDADPATYLGMLLDHSRLVRLSMTTDGGKEFSGIRRSDFSLRAQGGYAAMQAFVRDLESGPRLASVEAFDIRTQTDSSQLEGRFNISIYDPAGRE